LENPEFQNFGPDNRNFYTLAPKFQYLVKYVFNYQSKKSIKKEKKSVKNLSQSVQTSTQNCPNVWTEKGEHYSTQDSNLKDNSKNIKYREKDFFEKKKKLFNQDNSVSRMKQGSFQDNLQFMKLVSLFKKHNLEGLENNQNIAISWMEYIKLSIEEQKEALKKLNKYIYYIQCQGKPYKIYPLRTYLHIKAWEKIKVKENKIVYQSPKKRKTRAQREKENMQNLYQKGLYFLRMERIGENQLQNMIFHLGQCWNIFKEEYLANLIIKLKEKLGKIQKEVKTI